jgi:hypothetical protein
MRVLVRIATTLVPAARLEHAHSILLGGAYAPPGDR